MGGTAAVIDIAGRPLIRPGDHIGSQCENTSAAIPEEAPLAQSSTTVMPSNRVVAEEMRNSLYSSRARRALMIWPTSSPTGR